MKQYQTPALRAVLSIAVLLLCSLSIFAQQRQSEREFDGLRGAVKSVVTESAKLLTVNGKQVEEEKQIGSVITYDMAGNEIKAEFYQDGSPQRVSVYFDLDGDRAIKTEELRPLNLGRGGIGGGHGNPNVKPDPRFTVKLRYKFDAQGKRIEQTVINNVGNTTSRKVHKYDAKGNLKESTTYLGEQKVNQTFYKSDDKGNFIEISVEPDSKYFYTYLEFDEKGNWTKRTIKSVFKRKDKTSEYFRVNYRKISYH
ncbi:MAG: hypothetical protein H7Y30_03000 [Pyrinomonadaceae bacterium]|nr:hypothetical protein [Pyrinomonadaceae bacterium]